MGSLYVLNFLTFLKISQLNDLLSLGQHRVWKRMAVSWSGQVFVYLIFGFQLLNFMFCFCNIGIVGFRAKMGDQVLDLCCGSGDLSFLLSEKVGSNGKVISNTESPAIVVNFMFYEVVV